MTKRTAGKAKLDEMIVVKPCVRGTRITVETIQNYATFQTALQILQVFPNLTPEGLAAALAYQLPAKRPRVKRQWGTRAGYLTLNGEWITETQVLKLAAKLNRLRVALEDRR